MFQRLFDELFKRLFVPLDGWFSRLPPKRRFVCIILLLAIATIYFYRAPIGWELRIGWKLLAIAAGTHKNVPLQRVADSKLPLRISQADSSLQDYVASPGEKWIDAWSMGQALFATGGKFSADTNVTTIVAFFDAQRRGIAGLWAQFPTETEPIHVPATAWAILGCSTIGVFQSSKTFSDLLDLRLASGAWPIHPVDREERFASTYATVLAAAALHSQLDNRSLSETDRQKCTKAIKQATSWLIASRDGPTSQWKDYPNDPTGRAFPGVSGCVLYFLNRIVPDQMDDINRAWLDELANSIVPKDCLAYDISLTWVDTKTHSRRRDIISHYQTPWLLAGSAEAYRSGTLHQKARTVILLQDIIAATGAQYPETVSLPWIKAELVIGLNAIARMQ